MPKPPQTATRFRNVPIRSHPIASSFVREPQGNGVAERFVSMLKEDLLWIRPFATVLELVEALREFKRRYNEQWLIERHGFRTLSQVRAEPTWGARAVA